MGHVLNLCLVDVSSQVQSVRNNFGVISSLYNLIEGSAKRHIIFEKIQEEAGLKQLTVKQLCETRWTCRYEALKVILTRYQEIKQTLEQIEAPEAFLILNSIDSFDFTFHLFMMSELYLITNILSRYLQHANISLTEALGHVQMTVETLQNLRTEPEFDRFYSTALKMCEENQIDPPKEGRKMRVPAKIGGGDKQLKSMSIKDLYRVNTYYPVLDTIITSIESRFDKNLIGPVLQMEKLFLSKESLSEIELKQLSKLYSFSYDDLRGAQQLYKTKMANSDFNLSEATEFMVKNYLNISLPVMNELLRILWTIPVNVCGCERSFSSLRRLKTYLRNTTGQERLSGLALLHIERGITLNIESTMTEFISSKEGRKTIF